jgi:ACS family sodium-dependent inorganic phosphate cotransporter-like MFS transporter 5
MLAERIGGKWPFGIGMLVTAIFSLATPVAARSGKGALIFVRIVQGLGEVRDQLEELYMK